MSHIDRLDKDLADFKLATVGLFTQRKSRIDADQIAMLNTAAMLDVDSARERDEKYLRDRRRQEQQRRA